MASLSTESVLQLIPGDRYRVCHSSGPAHRCAYLGTAIMHGAIALIFEMPDGSVFHITDEDEITIENL